LILYDELCTPLFSDGIQLSNAKACKFNHNDFEDLERLIKTQDLKPKTQQVFTLLPNLFSMDGDCPNLEELVRISDKHHCYLVVDESHAWVFWFKGEGFVQMLGCKTCFARILTFENGLG
jgi:8-amino-7-oxononanoate synthase